MGSERLSGRRNKPSLSILLFGQKGSVVFFLVFLIFMAVVVYLKFYRAPSDDPGRPMGVAPLAKVSALRAEVTAAYGTYAPPEIRRAPANEAPSVPIDSPSQDTPVPEASPSSEAGYKAAVQMRAEDVQAEKRMYTREGSHFSVKFDGGENGVAGHTVAILLEEAYIKIGADLGFYPSDRIEAVLYTGDQFRDVTRSPAWAGALYDGRIKLPAGGITDKSALLEKTLFHEYTHAIVHSLSHGKAPTWLNEGLAQYEEGADDSGYMDTLREFARNKNKEFPLRRLEGSFMGLSASDARSAYILSLSATRYIIREFGVSAVKRILEGLAGGLSLDNAIRSAIYISYDDLEKSWLTSLAR